MVIPSLVLFQVCCGQSYRDNYEFKRHTREFHATGYACDFCPHVDTRRKGLERHLATHARNAGAVAAVSSVPLGHHRVHHFKQRHAHFGGRVAEDSAAVGGGSGQAAPIDYSAAMLRLATTPTSTMERASSPASASDTSSSSASSESNAQEVSDGGVVVMVADSSVNHNSQRAEHLPA